jgi:hypothetical protein
MRGKAALSEKFFLMGRFDVGGGGSKFTYQLFGGLGYNLNKKVALIGGYRALDVNYDRNNFLYDTINVGPSWDWDSGSKPKRTNRNSPSLTTSNAKRQIFFMSWFGSLCLGFCGQDRHAEAVPLCLYDRYSARQGTRVRYAQ